MAPSDFLFLPDGLRRGSGCEPLLAPFVLVLRGRIVHAGREPPPGCPEGLPTYSGGWLVEPLADAHVHLFLSGSVDPSERGRVAALDRDERVERALGILADYRRRGVAAVRDGGDPSAVALIAAKIANPNPARYAAVLPSGEPVFRRGAYGSFLGRGAGTVEEALALLEHNLRAGATHAKVLATGLNSLDQPGAVGRGGFDPSELSRIYDGASSLGMPLMVHANGPLEQLGDVLRHQGSLEHGFWTPTAKLAGTGLGWTPTLGAWGEIRRLPGLTARQLVTVEETDREQRLRVFHGRRAGVEILAGSDAGTPGVEHGWALVEELRRLAAAGLPWATALACSTFGARKLCERELGRSVGCLEEGGPAGFLWLDGDPAVYPEQLLTPRAVFLGGTWSAPKRSCSSRRVPYGV